MSESLSSIHGNKVVASDKKRSRRKKKLSYRLVGDNAINYYKNCDFKLSGAKNIIEYYENKEAPIANQFQNPDQENSYDYGFSLSPDDIKNLRVAAEAHRILRGYALMNYQPGKTYLQFVDQLENMNRKLLNEQGINRGIGFPAGVSRNDCAAHWTPNFGDTTKISASDFVKLDFGTQIGGFIIDSAFTICTDPTFDNLLMSTKEATATAIKSAGPDMLLGEIGGISEEIISSYEVEYNNKIYRIKPVANLCGHDIVKYCIHGGKTIPCVRRSGSERMLPGEIFAIETFASTGRGYVSNGLETSHYMLVSPEYEGSFKSKSAEALFNHIKKTFYTIPFASRWLYRSDGGSFFVNRNASNLQDIEISLSQLVKMGLLEDCPQLDDSSGSFVSQSEHCFIVRENGIEVLSSGDDY